MILGDTSEITFPQVETGILIPTQLRIRALVCYAMLPAALSFACVYDSGCFTCTHTVLTGEITFGDSNGLGLGFYGASCQ